MDKIPIFTPVPEIEKIWKELNTEIQNVLKKGIFIVGKNHKAFEREIASYLGVKHTIGLNSGTDALQIALEAMGVGSGDEVITSAFSFFATAETISRLGAKPVMVDIDPVTFNINPDEVRKHISKNTKAIVPVHLFGLSAEMDELMDISREFNLLLLEDTAQAMGGEYAGQKLGTIGHAGAFSFFPTKNLGAAGDAGLVATDDDEIADKVKLLKNHGSHKKYFNETIGYNSRLDELQAAILRVKLPHLEENNASRINAAANYDKLLKGCDYLTLPSQPDNCKHVFHQYTVRVKNGKRDELQKHLALNNISAFVYYPLPMNRLPVYNDLNISLPESEKAAQEVLSIPMWQGITTEIQERVAEAILSAF